MIPGKKLTLQDVVSTLRRRMWLLIVPPLVTGFAALVYSTTVQDLYQSDMLIEIVPQRVPDAFVRSTVTLRTEERLDAISVQVLSRTLLEQMIVEFNLYAAERQQLPMEDVVAKMRQSVETPLERPRQGPRGPEPPHAFHVKFTYQDPTIAARVTQRLGTLFVDHNTRDRGALADATNQFLETQLATARARLEAQERRLEAFREQHGNELPTQMPTNMQAIQNTQMQIQALVESIARDRDRKLMLERLLADAESQPILVAPPPVPQPDTPGDALSVNASAKQQLQVARESLARMELRLKPEHPDVVRTKRLIAELEPKAAAESEQSAPDAPASSPEEALRRERLSQMRAEIESLDRQTQFKESEERRLRALAADYQRRIEAVPGVESEWSVLTRDYDTHQAAYKDLLSKSEASRVAMDLERRQIGENFRILDPARVPVTPVASSRRQINGIGFALGFLLGVGLAAFLELRDATFRSEADVLDVLSLPVLALVPYVETGVERVRRRRRRLLVSFAALVATGSAAYVAWTMKLWNSVL